MTRRIRYESYFLCFFDREVFTLVLLEEGGVVLDLERAKPLVTGDEIRDGESVGLVSCQAGMYAGPRHAGSGGGPGTPVLVFSVKECIDERVRLVPLEPARGVDNGPDVRLHKDDP